MERCNVVVRVEFVLTGMEDSFCPSTQGIIEVMDKIRATELSVKSITAKEEWTEHE